MAEKTFAIVRDGMVENVIVAESIDIAKLVSPPDVTVVSTEDIPGAWIGSVVEDAPSQD
jgi:hypothetical protein